MAAKREESAALVPWRQVLVCQALAGKACASSFAEVGLCSGWRRTSEGGRPRPLHGLGGRGPVPAGHRLVEDWTPTTYVKPIFVSSVRKAVSMPKPASASSTPLVTPAASAA